MKIAIIGGTGGTGAELIKQALDRGHTVTAIARKPDAIRARHERLRVAIGDVMNDASLDTAFAGQDAVLSALGYRGIPAFAREITLYSAGGRGIARAMERTKLSRLIAVTSGGVEDDDPTWNGFLYERILKPYLIKKGYDDMKRFERDLRTTALAWTIVRPTALTDGPRTTSYRVSARYAPKGGTKISRADLAAFMLDELESPKYPRGTPTLAY